MSLVKLKAKGQMTLPVEIRRQLELKQGDLLSVELQGENVVLTPKEVVNRHAAFERMSAIADEARKRWEADGMTEEDMERLIDETIQEVRAENYAREQQT